MLVSFTFKLRQSDWMRSEDNGYHGALCWVVLHHFISTIKFYDFHSYTLYQFYQILTIFFLPTCIPSTPLSSQPATSLIKLKRMQPSSPHFPTPPSTHLRSTLPHPSTSLQPPRVLLPTLFHLNRSWALETTTVGHVNHDFDAGVCQHFDDCL